MKREEYTEEYLLSVPIKVVRAILRDDFNGTPGQLSKRELVDSILAAQSGKQINKRTKRGRRPLYSVNDGTIEETKCKGIVDMCPDGYAFLRCERYVGYKRDVFIPRVIIKQYGLRNGDLVKGDCVKIREKEQPALQKVVEINDFTVDDMYKRVKFDDLVPCYPHEKITLERKERPDDYSIRCIDLLCPIGKGQRGLIVAPPKTGKTTLLEKIALSIEENYPDIKVLVLLIDERPEEVTEFKKCVQSEVICSTFDESPEHHIKVAELVSDRAKRLVESGFDVVILLDSITKLTRAYNACTPPSGRTLSGGLDPMAVIAPKKFFGSARNIENGGSLTIIATALIETGSRMDEVVYEEFKGTGNMEIKLSGELSEQRVFPAIDLYKSGTRKEELLLSKEELNCAYKVRKLLRENPRASESFLEMLAKTKTNGEFVVRFEEWLKIMK